MNQYEKIHNELMFENHKGRVYTLLSKYDEMTLKQLNRFYEKKNNKNYRRVEEKHSDKVYFI